MFKQLLKRLSFFIFTATFFRFFCKATTALLKRTRAIYRALGLPTRAGANKEKVLAYMQHDKKARGDYITVIKCPGLGCWRADKLPMTELPGLLGLE